MAQRRITSPSAMTMIAIGIPLSLLASNLHGFLRGLCQGAGIALILLGVVVLSPHLRRARRPADERDLWLPSRDRDEQ